MSSAYKTFKIVEGHNEHTIRARSPLEAIRDCGLLAYSVSITFNTVFATDAQNNVNCYFTIKTIKGLPNRKGTILTKGCPF